MSKQSSIDWFLSEFEKQIQFRPNSELDVWFKDLFPKAKAMHKREIEFTYNIGWADGHDEATNESPLFTTGEQYYKENYE